MTFFWNRRRPSLGKRILGSILLSIAAAGVSVAAEILRRRLRIGSVVIEGRRVGRRARVSATVRRSGGRRRGRILSAVRT